MISYEKLRNIIKERGIKESTLTRVDKLIGGSTFRKIVNNDDIRVSTLNKLCNYLHCDIMDLIEYIPDDGSEIPKAKTEETESKPSGPSVNDRSTWTREFAIEHFRELNPLDLAIVFGREMEEIEEEHRKRIRF